MSTYIEFRSNNNLVTFCELSLDSVAIDKIIKKHKDTGLLDPNLEMNLREGKYQDVLQSVWSERDRTRRLEWLKSKSEELHPVLMYELAISEFTNSPNIETIHNISIPLIKSATFRVLQDCQCSEEGSVKNGDAGYRLEVTYLFRLNALVKKKLNQEITSKQDSIRKKVLETAQRSLQIQLPSPDWVGWTGMSVFIRGAPRMYSSERFKEIRDAFATQQISKIEQLPRSSE